MSIIKHSVDNWITVQRRVRESVSLKKGLPGIVMISLFVVGSLAVAAPSTLRITIRTFAPYYSPTFVHINTNTSISWENPTSALHSITHDDCRNGAQCAFDSGPLGPNSNFTVHQLSPGSYSYHCSFHPIMRGVLIVKDTDNSNET